MTELRHELQAATAAAVESQPAAASAAAVADRAAAAGLLDVAYASVGSPLGELTIAATPRGLVRVAFDTLRRDAVLQELATLVSPRVLEAPARLDDARRQFEEYFEGRRQRFQLGLDWSLTRGFFRRVLRATARIDYGEVSTYTRVAARAGSPRGVRAAGNALASNPLAVVVPCHRVLRTGGGLGGYGGGLDRKRLLLDLERANRRAEAG